MVNLRLGNTPFLMYTLKSQMKEAPKFSLSPSISTWCTSIADDAGMQVEHLNPRIGTLRANKLNET